MADLVFDAFPLSQFARAGRLDTLERLTAGHGRIVTRAVLDEIRNGVAKYETLAAMKLPWLEHVAVDSLEELRAFAIYAARLGSGERNVGEATTLAWAEAPAWQAARRAHLAGMQPTTNAARRGCAQNGMAVQ